MPFRNPMEGILLAQRSPMMEPLLLETILSFILTRHSMRNTLFAGPRAAEPSVWAHRAVRRAALPSRLQRMARRFLAKHSLAVPTLTIFVGGTHPDFRCLALIPMR